MPFEFNNKPPNFGSSNDAFSSFTSFASSSATQVSKPAFGSTPSFGAPASLSITTPSSSPWSTAVPSTGLSSSPRLKTIGSAPADNSNESVEPSSDPILSAVHRAKQQRPALFGAASIAADAIVRDYQDAAKGAGELGAQHTLNQLQSELADLAKTHPETLRLLRCTFERATRHDLETAVATKSTIVRTQTEVDDVTPDVFIGIEMYSSLYHAIHSAIQREYATRKAGMPRDTNLPIMTTRMVAASATKADVENELYYGHSYGTREEAKDFADWIFEKVWRLKKESDSGWRVDDRDDASYFGAGYYLPGTEMSPQEREALVRDREERHKAPDYELCCREMLGNGGEQRDEVVETPFRFLDLPAEMRTMVYGAAMVPGCVSLRSCIHHMPYGASPTPTPGLLATCKQINQEAADLVFENTFMVDVLLHSGTPRSALHGTQVPAHIVPKLRYLVLVIDGTEFAYSRRDRVGVPTCDWTPLQVLTSLQSLRVTFIEGKPVMPFKDISSVLAEVVARVPACCSIEYGCSSEDESAHVHDMMERMNQDEEKLKPADTHRGEVLEMNMDVSRDANADIPASVVKGSRSGEKPRRFVAAVQPGKTL
ncbi:hypothetical protein LTR37_012495 [Vermiconidia calcicola]|uniref:Uncharacterized protein n=1 Tax=Vermiconidia calcicola TaxID=1690605 RepID=A0ACC3N0P3_9PEZI|nr:hypothetical protein LTR37_012495 [Vermiconidia calcicola]